jgi:hypothetical protein
MWFIQTKIHCKLKYASSLKNLIGNNKKYLIFISYQLHVEITQYFAKVTAQFVQINTIKYVNKMQ